MAQEVKDKLAFQKAQLEAKQKAEKQKEADAQPPANRKVTVNTPVTRATRPVVAGARADKGEQQTRLTSLTTQLNDKQNELAGLAAPGAGDRPLHPSITQLHTQRTNTLNGDIAGLKKKIGETRKKITTADTTIAAGNVVLYGEQAKADQAAAKRSAQEMKGAHEGLARNLPKGVSLKAGETLTTEQAGQLKPEQQARYKTYLNALKQARTDQAQAVSSVAAGNFNYSKLQQYASDPDTRGSVKTAIGEINDALRPQNLRFTSPKALSKAAAAKNLDAADEALEQANAVRVAAGQTPVLDSRRTAIGNDMMQLAGGGHYQGVKSSAITELLYTTRNDATPGDRLDDLVAQMKARRPGDEKFTSAIDAAAAELGGLEDPRTDKRTGGLWEGLGRSHTVLDPITRAFDEAQRTGDMGKFKGVVTNQFEKLANVDPTVAGIEARKTLLLRFGLTDPADKPALPAFQKAINEASTRFLQDRPQEIADGVQKTYEKKGDLAAAEDLRNRLSTADPVTSALVLNKASGTINKIGGGFSFQPGPEFVKYQNIYNNLSGAVESAGRSPDSRQTIDALAKVIGANSKFSFAQKAVGEGHGATLSVAVAKNSPAEIAATVRSTMTAGLKDLETTVLDKVKTFAGSAMSVTEPVNKWGPVLKPEQIGRARQQWQNQPPGFINRANDDLQAVDKLAGQYFRALTALQGYGDELENSGAGKQDPDTKTFIETVDKHIKAAETDPKLKFAFQFSKTTYDEALRAFSTERTASGEAYSPKQLQAIIDKGNEAVDGGTDLGRITTYASFGVLPSFFLLSKIKYGTKANVGTIGLLPEQFLRDGLVRFASGSNVVDNPVLNAVAKATIADVATLMTNPLMNKYLGSRWEAFRVPQHLLAGRLAIPPLVGAGNLLTEQIWPGAPAPGGNMGEWLLNRTPDAANLGLSVGIPGTLISAYGAGLEKLYPDGVGAPTLREAYKGGKLLEILRAGKFKAPGAFGFITGIVALQYFGSEALAERPPTGTRMDLPPLESSPADWGVGVSTSLGSLAAPALISGPWGWVAAGAIALGGQLLQGGINDARRAAQFEGPTRSYLEAAGIRPEIAKVLADYDDNGYDVAGRINALAQYRGVSPQSLLRHLDGLSPGQVRSFVNATHHVEPDEKGRYTIDDSASDYFGKLPVYGSWMPSDEKYRIPAEVRPHSVAALNWWAARFMPGLPEGQPTAPPSGNVNSREYQAWLKTPGGRAWTAREDRAYLAQVLGIPNVPAG